MKRHPKRGYPRHRPSPARRARNARRRAKHHDRFTSNMLLQSTAPGYYRPCCATCGCRVKVLLGTDGRSFFCARTMIRGPYGQRMLIDRHVAVQVDRDEKGATVATVKPLMGIV